MLTVYKYDLNTSQGKTITGSFMPENAEIIDVMQKGGIVVMYAMIDLTVDPEDYKQRQFITYRTGETFLKNFKHKHVGTTMINENGMHVFELLDG